MNLLSDLAKVNGPSSERVTKFLEKIFSTRNNLKWLQNVPKSVQQTVFDNFSIFRGILVQVKLLLVTIEPTVPIDSNELCLLQQGDQFLRENFLYFKQSGIDCKKFQSVHTEPLLKIFSFQRNFSIGQSFTSYGRYYCPNFLK